MDTYLCTRNQPYTNPNCLGHTDLEARQGYYIDAESSALAIALMQEHFPDDTDGFTARALGNLLSCWESTPSPGGDITH